MTDANVGSEASADIVRLLALVEQRPGRDQMLPYLSHPHPVVRQTAVDVVAELRPDWGFDALCLALLDATDRVRVAAAVGLRSLQSLLPDRPQLFDFLQQALESPSPLAREVAVRLLRRTSDASIATFAVAVDDPEPRVRIEAVRALVGLHAVQQIRGLAVDPVGEVRVEVAKALGRLADAQGLVTVRALAVDVEPDVRAAAVEALSAIGPTGRSIDTVLAAVDDSAAEVRRATAVALARGDAEAVLPALLRLANDPVDAVRKAALVALAGRPASSAPAWDALIEATHDADAQVRAIARAALRGRSSQPAMERTPTAAAPSTSLS